MVRALLITASLSLAFGTICGYYLQKLEANHQTPAQSAQPVAAQSATQKTDEAIAANLPNPKREENLLKLSLCLNRPISKQLSDKWTDKQLNDLTFDACKTAK